MKVVYCLWFTGKELDEETGLYYYGQRYLDSQYNIWMTSDPAIYDYMSQSKNGEGGIYNITNLNLYHYAGNNPIKYTDPDGRSPQPEVMTSAGAVAVSTEAIAVQGIENFVGKSPIIGGIFLILLLLTGDSQPTVKNEQIQEQAPSPTTDKAHEAAGEAQAETLPNSDSDKDNGHLDNMK